MAVLFLFCALSRSFKYSAMLSSLTVRASLFVELVEKYTLEAGQHLLKQKRRCLQWTNQDTLVTVFLLSIGL